MQKIVLLEDGLSRSRGIGLLLSREWYECGEVY